MNTRVKGRHAENEYKQTLEILGYTVEIVPGATKFKKQVDFFGIGDLIAFNSEHFIIVQVKCNSTAGAIKQLKKWKQKYNPPQNCKLQVAVRYDNKSAQDRWKVIEI